MKVSEEDPSLSRSTSAAESLETLVVARPAFVGPQCLPSVVWTGQTQTRIPQVPQGKVEEVPLQVAFISLLLKQTSFPPCDGLQAVMLSVCIFDTAASFASVLHWHCECSKSGLQILICRLNNIFWSAMSGLRSISCPFVSSSSGKEVCLQLGWTCQEPALQNQGMNTKDLEDLHLFSVQVQVFRPGRFVISDYAVYWTFPDGVLNAVKSGPQILLNVQQIVTE